MTDTAASETPPDTSPPAGKRIELLRHLRDWHHHNIVGPFDPGPILDNVHEDSRCSGRYAFMTAMSAGIAILGLLLSSPAVIIGAMLVSPLMGPIVGLGFALATIDWASVRKSMLALVAGSLLAILLSALIVLFSPLKDMTPEILSRTRPSLFDLLVAVFSGLAGGYATVRGRGEAIVGVAIATALMPPLAVVGYGMATGNGPVLTGSFALFLTNFLAIAIAAGLVARFYGFGASLTPRQTNGQLAALLLLSAILATPLFFSLRQIAWEALATRSMRSALNQEFGGSGRIASLDPGFSAQKVTVRATILTDRYHDKAEADLERRLEDAINRPVTMELSQILVNQGDTLTELDRARALEARNREDRVARADLAARLALVSGMPVTDVLVDPVARVATAQAPAGLSLLQTMQAEARLAADSPGWKVKLLPPAGPFPALEPPADDNDNADDSPEIAAVVWALQRLGTDSALVSARQLAGEPRARANARAARIADMLRQQGITVKQAPPLAPDRALERELGLVALRKVTVEPLARSETETAPGQPGEAARPAPPQGSKGEA